MGKGDVEAGGEGQLYPMMLERPEIRWAFIRKVYCILTMQLLMTVVIAAIVVASGDSIPDFMLKTRAGKGLYIIIAILSLIRTFQIACLLLFDVITVSCRKCADLLYVFSNVCIGGFAQASSCESHSSWDVYAHHVLLLGLELCLC